MTKLFKRAMSGILTASIAVSGMAFSTLSASAATTYEFDYKQVGGSAPTTELKSDGSSDLNVWLGGGVATYANGATSNAKVVETMLFSVEDGNYYDITKSKNILWGVGTKTAATLDSKNKPLKNNDNITVAAGKVTAKTEATNSDGTYVWALQAVKNEAPIPLASFKVNVKQAPSKVAVYSKAVYSSDGTKINDTVISDTKAVAKTVTVGLYDSVTVYPYSIAPTGKTVSADATYSASINNDFATIAAVSGDLKNLSLSDIANGITITGAKLDKKSDKDTDGKSKVTFINNESGKKVDVTVTVTNTVASVTDFTVAITNTVDKAGEVKVDLKANSDGITLNSDGFALLSAAPKVGVYKTAKTASDGISTDGKIALPTTATDKSTNVTAKIGTDKVTLTITGKKGISEEAWIMVAYGPSVDQILIIHVTAAPVVGEVTLTVNVTGSDGMKLAAANFAINKGATVSTSDGVTVTSASVGAHNKSGNKWPVTIKATLVAGTEYYIQATVDSKKNGVKFTVPATLTSSAKVTGIEIAALN